MQSWGSHGFIFLRQCSAIQQCRPRINAIHDAIFVRPAQRVVGAGSVLFQKAAVMSRTAFSEKRCSLTRLWLNTSPERRAPRVLPESFSSDGKSNDGDGCRRDRRWLTHRSKAFGQKMAFTGQRVGALTIQHNTATPRLQKDARNLKAAISKEMGKALLINKTDSAVTQFLFETSANRDQ